MCIRDSRNSMGMKVEGMVPNKFTNGRRNNNNMKLIKVILSDENLNEAIRRVKSNKGVPGVDKMTVYEMDEHLEKNMESIKPVSYTHLGAGDKNLAPIFTRGCTVTFNPNGGALKDGEKAIREIDLKSVENGQFFDIGGVIPVREGYTFAGWYT